MKRREFVKLTLGAGLASLVPTIAIEGCKSPTSQPIALDPTAPNALRIPPVITGGPLFASYANVQVWQGRNTNVLTLNGGYTGPTLLLQRNAQFNLTFHNALDEPSIVHWHGLNAPSEMDGHPKYTIPAGSTYQYSYPIQQRAGTYWYHAHPDGATAKQVYKGLAGAYIVEDEEEKALNLPSGPYDVPLLLQDTRQVPDYSTDYNPVKEDILTGFLGNAVLANGTPNAYLEVEQSLYRLRLVNASNARVYKIAFADNRTFKLIGTDGGLIESPVDLKSFNLSPAERAEIIVDFSKDALGQSVKLLSLAYEFNSSHRGATYPQGMPLDILDCRVTAKATTQANPIPGSLSTIEKLSAPVRTRIFMLTMDHSKSKGMHMINDLVFDMNRIDETINQGDIELWEFQNTADAFHSMHIHGGQFQISERLYAGPITPIDFGWKDTVLVYPNETVRVLVRFKDYKGLYLLHCHTLEHEDDGMMINVMVD